MLDKLVLGVGNIVIMYKSVQLKLPRELDDIVSNQKLFWIIFTWLYIDNIIKNKFVTFWIVLVFSAYLYKDELEDFVRNQELHENIADNLSNKISGLKKIKNESLETLRDLGDTAKNRVRENVTDRVSDMF